MIEVFEGTLHDAPYYPETDSLYIELTAMVSAETWEIGTGLNIDLAAGSVVGIDIHHASQSSI